MTWRPHVRVLRTQWHQHNAYNFLEKEGCPMQTGRFVPPLRPRGTGTGPATGSELLAIASSSSVEQAVQHFDAQGGSLAQVCNVSRGLRTMMETPAPQPRFNPVPPDTILRPWQREVLAVFYSEPEPRRLLWIQGPPGVARQPSRRGSAILLTMKVVLSPSSLLTAYRMPFIGTPNKPRL